MRVAYLALLAASPAFAGRSLYGWLPPTDTLPDGAVELATSVYEHDNLGPYHERSTFLAWTPAIALRPCLELAFPIELVTLTADDVSPTSGISRYGAELRYRFLPRSSALHAVARFGVSRNVAIQSQVRSEAGASGSYDVDRVQLAATLGGVLDINFGHPHVELHPGLGASTRVGDELRLGAELYAQLSRDDTVPSWAVLGPDLAWQRGRFWLSAEFGVGISHVTAAPRLNLGTTW